MSVCVGTQGVQWKSWSVCMLLLFATTAHARNEQGSVDYAKVRLGTNGESCQPFVRKYESVCANTFQGDWTVKDEVRKGLDLRAQTGKNSSASPSGPVDACSGRNPLDHPEVKKGQIISVKVLQTFIHDFQETTFFGPKVGEIAVVGNVREQDAGNDFDFTPAGVDRARMIYYSDGVRQKQFLNFSQLPVYGPIEYGGKPLNIEFYIVELDKQNNSQVSELLATVAGLGAVAYPPASPTLKFLGDIGSSLIKGNDNDLQLKYHATLAPGESVVPNLPFGRLEYGNYVFVRMPYATPDAGGGTTPLWTKWFFNQKNGRVYEDASCSKPLEDHTYLSVQINRAAVEASLDAQNTMAAVMSRLQAQAKENAAGRIEAVQNLASLVRSDSMFDDARKLIELGERGRWQQATADPSRQCTTALIGPLLSRLHGLVDDVQSSLVFDPATAAAGSSPKYPLVRARRLADLLNGLSGAKNASYLTFDPGAVKGEIQTPTQSACS